MEALTQLLQLQKHNIYSQKKWQESNIFGQNTHISKS